MSNVPFDRIEDLFEPLGGPDVPEPQQPASVDEVMAEHGFEATLAAMYRLIEREENR